MTGTSTINHAIRVKLKLNCLEYCVADFIYQGLDARHGAVDYLKISNDQFICTLNSLEAKQIISFDFDRIYSMTEKWNAEFRMIEPANLIDQIWPLHKYGNKPTCIKRLPQVLKKISMEELIVKLKAYLKACSEGDVSTKMLSTWLDPAKEHWNDPLPKPMKKFTNSFTPVPKQDNANYTLK